MSTEGNKKCMKEANKAWMGSNERATMLAGKKSMQLWWHTAAIKFVMWGGHMWITHVSAFFWVPINVCVMHTHTHVAVETCVALGKLYKL